jgi:G3E family GTPase
MIKVDIISGFLGAGKTTLIKKLLSSYKEEMVVLIENEFGEIGVDGEIIERDGFEVFEISSGCICCIMQKDFIEVLERIIKEYNPDRIVIEPTGISILSDIVEIFKKDEFKYICSINSLITVVDSLNYLEQHETFGEFFEDQISNAKTLMLSKVQYIDENKMTNIINSLRELNHDADIIMDVWAELTLEGIRNIAADGIKIDFTELVHAKHRPCRENEFDTFAIETKRKYSKTEALKLLDELKDPKYGKVLRGKGFLKGNDGYIEFSYTNGRYEINEGITKSSGRLCLIGKSLNNEELKKLFNVKDGGIFSWLKF